MHTCTIGPRECHRSNNFSQFVSFELVDYRGLALQVSYFLLSGIKLISQILDLLLHLPP